MNGILRTVFCILAVLCAAAVFPVGVFVDWIYVIYLIVATVAFAFLMVVFKRRAEQEDVVTPKTDFMLSDEENEKRMQEYRTRKSVTETNENDTDRS